LRENSLQKERYRIYSLLASRSLLKGLRGAGKRKPREKEKEGFRAYSPSRVSELEGETQKHRCRPGRIVSLSVRALGHSGTVEKEGQLNGREQGRREKKNHGPKSREK